MVKDYINAQMKADYGKLAGKEISEEDYKHLQDLALLVSGNSIAQEYLQAFIRWNQVAADLQKSFQMQWRRVWMYWNFKNDRW